MADLTRTRPSDENRTRVIFVRQPIKSVGPETERDRLGVRLAIGVIAALGAAAALWALGFLGYHLGFAPAIGVPELEMPAGGGLIAGLRLLVVLPGAVIAAALAEPVWLMIGFLLIAIPAASLAVIGPPRTPGGPRPHILAVVFSNLGAVAACVLAILLVWWTVLPFRLDRVTAMPLQVAAFDSWIRGLRIAVGLDAIAVVAGSLWTVLVMRLVIPPWLKGLSATAIIAALALMVIAMSMSAGTLSQMEARRSAIDHVMVIGRVEPGQVAVLRTEQGSVEIAVVPPPSGAVSRRSIAEHLRVVVVE